MFIYIGYWTLYIYIYIYMNIYIYMIIHWQALKQNDHEAKNNAITTNNDTVNGEQYGPRR